MAREKNNSNVKPNNIVQIKNVKNKLWFSSDFLPLYRWKFLNRWKYATYYQPSMPLSKISFGTRGFWWIKPVIHPTMGLVFMKKILYEVQPHCGTCVKSG